jgi:restriction endonuclease S subunit
MTRLGSIAEVRMGATLRGRDATRPVPNGRFQFVRIGNISQDGRLVNDKFDRIDPNESISQELFLRSGDVLFPNRGTRTTAFTYRLDQGETLVGAQFFILRPDANIVLPEYLAWFLRTEEAAKYFEGHRRGTYVQIIQRSILTDLEMPLPPLAVQHRIVEMAELAITERNLTERLADLKWKLANNQLRLAAQSSAGNNRTKSPE